MKAFEKLNLKSSIIVLEKYEFKGINPDQNGNYSISISVFGKDTPKSDWAIDGGRLEEV